MNADIKIVLIDDQEIMRCGLRHMLEQQGDIEVVGDYASAREAFPEIVRLRPDIVLVDTLMPEMSGIEATHHLRRNGLHYEGDVIVLAECADRQAEALEAGASRFLLKDIKCTELVQTIREVYWSKHSPGDRNELVEEVVELVVPPDISGARLLKFICQLESRLNDSDGYHYASIMQVVGSWEWGTVITIVLQPAGLANLRERLAGMAEVDKVEEKATSGSAFSDFPRKFGVIPDTDISPTQRIYITLEESETITQNRKQLLAVPAGC